MTSTSITTAAALIEGDACEPIWRIVRAELARRQRDGGQVRPSVQRAVEALRASAQAHLSQQAMFAREHASGPTANIAPESMVSRLATTKDLADRLNVSEVHARRLASEAGIEPMARNAWRHTDVDELVQSRRNTP